MIIVIPGVFSPTEVERIRGHLDAADWQDGNATAGAQAQQVKQNQQLPLDSQLTRQLGEIILSTLGKHPTFISAALPLKIFPPMFNRYRTGETYGLHVDNAIRYAPGSPTPIRTDLSATLFFSEPDEYDGGELVIQDTYGTQRVKFAAGDMVLYPSTSLHKVEAVTRGARLASFFWIQSLVREDAQRTLLYEMDQAIQKLTADVPDHPSLVQLTGTYHNLLRRWVDV